MYTYTQRRRERKRKLFSSLLLMLLLVSYTTFSAVLFIWDIADLLVLPGRASAVIVIVPTQVGGDSSGEPGGDKIGGEPGEESQRRIDVVGEVVYTDGSPYANGLIELRSDPRYTWTDSEGRFTFTKVETGEHTLSVIKDGRLLASCLVQLEYDLSLAKNIIRKTADGRYEIQICAFEITVEVVLEIDGDELVLTDETGMREELPDRAPGLLTDDTIAPRRYWTQSIDADIFGERSGNIGVRLIDGMKVIAPGAKGSYTFRIENPEAFDVRYTIGLSETDENVPKVPLQYRLKYGTSGSNYTGDGGWRSITDIGTVEQTIAAGDVHYYTLEWRWDPSEDLMDTRIGTQKGKPVYMLKITIDAVFK